MNLFSTEPYLEALGAVYFPGKQRSIEHRRVGTEVFRLLVVDGKPITQAPFLDFFQPLENAASTPAPVLGYLPKVVLATNPVQGRPTNLNAERSVGPFISWDAFATRRPAAGDDATRGRTLCTQSRQKLKKIAKDLGPLDIRMQDTRSETFQACIKWKSAQYRASGLPDMFAAPANVEMFRELVRRGVAHVSSLSGGSTLLAVHIGALADNRFYSWVPAYDPAYSKLSPGRLLMELLLEDSQASGHREFDFLIGDEPYKWRYATHNREIGALGKAPLSLRLERRAKRRFKEALAPHPRLLALATEIRQKLR